MPNRIVAQHNRTTFAIGLALTALAALGLAAAFRGTTPDPAPTLPPATSGRQPVPDDPEVTPTPPSPVTDPVTTARLMATELLTWDTAIAVSPGEHTTAFMAMADPSRIETAGLLSDLTNYLPTATEWAQLRRAAVTQRVTIINASVPDAWDDIAAQTTNLPDGTIGVTLDVLRHRRGVSAGQTHTADHPLTFTMFMRCPTTGDRCHLLRLSLPDTPLH